jgi:hypothetical protein
MLQELIDMLNAMKQNSDYKEGWSKLEPLIGLNGIISLSWPQWRLKLVTFRMPREWDNTPESAQEIKTIDNLFWHNDKIIWITDKNKNDYNATELERVAVTDVVDEFLSGNWTPPWKCGYCVTRHKGTTIPKF